FTRSSTCLFFLLFRRQPSSTLFPYTTLFDLVRWSNVTMRPDPASMRGDGKSAGRARCTPRMRIGSVPKAFDTRNRRLEPPIDTRDRKSTRLNSSHVKISYAVFCLKKKKNNIL